MSNRKPHNDTAGYVCERKSYHPNLPGHFMVIDIHNGGSWMRDESNQDRWACVHINGDVLGSFITFSSKVRAIEIMKDMAAGNDAADYGQFYDV